MRVKSGKSLTTEKVLSGGQVIPPDWLSGSEVKKAFLWQVVSYSYLAAPQGQSHSKDVVYGSGAAAKPPSSGHSFSARSPTLGQTLSLETQKSGHTAAPGHASDHTHLSTTPPVITAFESSKLSHISPSSLVHSSSFSAPSPFFSSSFSPSAHSSSPHNHHSLLPLHLLILKPYLPCTKLLPQFTLLIPANLSSRTPLSWRLWNVTPTDGRETLHIFSPTTAMHLMNWAKIISESFLC
ncbi:uncharacterized protein LOC135092953 [Scylla paramamosain]|uniref:uncharacterized protein LOC135092953 n=1 Tax=Scylla paramamosain TaxID=85552 RepID=UPI0030839816